MNEKELIYIDINDIVPNATQPRATFSEKGLTELADSIRAHGVLEPILVVRTGAYYKVIAGERRYRASRIAGKTKIPAIVLKEKEEELWSIAIVENLQRQNLNPIEEALAIKALIDRYALTQEEAAGTLGRSRPAICNLLRILALPDEVQQLVRAGQLSQGHARAILALPNPKAQIAMARQCVDNKWSVHALTQEIQAKTAKPAVKQGKTNGKTKAQSQRFSPEMRRFVQDLERTFQLPVRVKGTENRGELILEYSGVDDLQPLYQLLQRLHQDE